ncbi:MAG: hypothetical protein R2780_05685 [Crocinitomicaceae bacterium]
MSDPEFKYILSDPDQGIEARKQGFHVLSRADHFVFVKEVSDCLNAERQGAHAVIWDSDEFDQLQELSPKKREYGWMLVSLNIPIYIYLKADIDLNEITGIDFQGFYADDLELLLAAQKKYESLNRE